MFGGFKKLFSKRKKPAERPARVLRYEELEPRVLFSADMLPGLDNMAVEEQVLVENTSSLEQVEQSKAPAPVEQPAAAARRELVIVNPNVTDYQQLTAGLQGSDNNRIIDVVVMAAGRDGIEQVSEILADRSDLAAVHFITHGADGQINLGDSWLNRNSLQQNSESVADWGKALNEEGDFLFYGCDIAADSPGQNLLSEITRLTGADVAASDDLTGSAQFGGDWVLEYDRGSIETALAINSEARQNWNGVLATFTVLSKETADLNDDGFIDAIHVTFSGAVKDSTVSAGDWDVAGVTGEAFASTTNGDTVDDADIYITFADGVLDSGAIPNLIYTQNATTDLADNLLAGDDTTPWWNTNWQQRTKITFDNTNSAENLTDFPVLVSLTSADVDFAKIKAGGADIRFVDDDGTLLNYQIEDWDDGSETAKIWVRVQQLDQLSNSDFIHIYYNNAAAGDGQNAAGVWDDDYEGVWHLDEGDSTAADFYKDSTANNAHGTLTDADADSTAGNGKIGGAYDFNGDADYISIADFSQHLTTSMTISGWVQPASSTPSGHEGFFGIRNPAAVNNSFYILQLAGTNDLEMRFIDSVGVEAYAANVASAVSGGTWVHVALTYDGDTLISYVDGQFAGQNTSATGSFNLADLSFQIGSDGKSPADSHEIDGIVDEVRASSTNRSADWIEASYLSQNGMFVFTSFGTEQVTTTDRAAPVLLSKETADLTSDGFIDAIHLTFSEEVSDASVEVGDFTISAPGVTGLAFNPTAGGDTADDEDIYLSFDDGVHATGITPTVAYAQSGATDLQDLSATPNKVADFTANDNPLNSVPGAQVTNEDTALVFDTAGGNLISISDADAGGSPVKVTLNGTNGLITLSDTAGLSFSTGDGTADANMTFTGTIADINTALDGLTFDPAPEFSGAASLQIITDDQGNTGAGGPQADDDTIAITVTEINDAPTVVLSNTVTSIGEDADTTLRTKVADITVTDDALGTNVLSLSGADTAMFEIDSGVLYLKAGAALDYETNAQLDVTVAVDDATLAPNPNDTADLSITVDDANEAPQITSDGGGDAASVDAAENQTGVTTVTASDFNSDTPTYSITGGADAGLFGIDTNSGVLTFNAAPDFEVFTDADNNGVYEVEVTADDGNGGIDVQTISVTVTDTRDLPIADIAGGPYMIDEGDSVALDASPSTDPDGDSLTYAWDIDDDGQFDDATGVSPTLTWAQLQDLGISDDGVYNISVQVDDATDGTDTASTTLTVANTAPTLTIGGESWADDGGLYTLDLSASDPGDDTITGWTINWGDGTIETINGNPASVTHTYTGVGRTYNILAAATDGDGTFLQNELLVPSYAAGDSVFRYEATTGAFLQEFATAEGLDDPVQAIIGPDGSIYVAGEISDNVLRYNAITGGFIDTFVSAGSGGLSGATGMVFGADGNLYVSSIWTNEVLRYDGTSGDFIDAFVTAASGGLSQPYSLAIGPDGDLYVNSYSDSLVLRYNGTTGAFIDVFVSSGSGGLSTPECMIFGRDGNLYIASYDTNEVLRYNGTTGEFIDDFISAGLGGLNGPAGLAFGPDGNLYVADYVNAAVLRYNGTTGGFIDEYVSAGSGGLTSPAWHTFLPNQQVTVTRAPVIGGTSADQPVSDTAAISPFAAVTITDADPGDTVTVTVTFSDGDDNGTFTAASLGASGFSKTGTGEYSLSAAAPAAAQSAIRQLVFDPTENQVAPGGTVTTTFTIEVNDSRIAAIDTTTTVIATSINYAPTVNGTFIMTSTDEDTTSAAVRVGAILADAAITVNDPDGDTPGMAVVAKTGLGTWQYSTDGAGGWTGLGPAGADAAVLLSETTWLRYVPDGVNGESAGLDFCAWDQTAGAASTTGSPSVGDTTPGGGTAAYSAGTGAVALTVTEINDGPTVALSNTTTSISETADTTSRTRVADITVTDDAPGTNVLSLAGADAGLFEIESGLLYLKAGADLDFETNPQLDVTVQVNDAALAPDPNDTDALSVTVTDVNEAPTVALSNTTTSISEGADTTSRTKVADITVTDDALGTGVLSLAGADAGLFEIDSDVLYLKAGADLDFETNPQLDVTVQVNDPSVAPEPNDTADLSITVTDVNETPTVALSNTATSISEGADTTNRTKVADITVTDDAMGTNGLSLSGADAGLFEIDSGVLYLKASAALDFETNPQLDVTLQVNDDTLAPDPNDTAALSITVTDANDSPTVALSNTMVSISEGADTTTRTKVADITVTDDPLGTNVLSLSGVDAGLFEIDSGVLYLKAGVVLDQATNAQLDVTVQVNDATLLPDPNHTANLSIAVNAATGTNNPPTVALSNTTTSISEAADTANRTQVADITVTDDALGTNVLSLSGTDAGLFEIDSGVLYLKAGANLDHETNAQLDVTVVINDASLLPDPNDTAALSITVTDTNDAPVVALSNTTTSISEAADTTARTKVADITVTDDALGTNVLSLSGADAGLFEIDSGVLYLKAGAALDYETNAQLSVTVQVNDATLAPDPNDTADLSILVTDANEAPTVAFSNTTTSISEAADTDTRTRVADITVTDDALGTEVLSLTGADADLFEIDAGVLYLKSGVVLDYETNAQLDVTVQVNDATLLPDPNDTADLSITVTNVNDPPTINALAGYDVDEDGDYLLLQGISIADVDAGNADVRVTLDVANGVLRIGNTAGLKTISGNSSASVVMEGPVADLNGALASLSYRPNADFSGSDNPLVTVDDLGNAGSGGPHVASQRLSLVVNPVNDPGEVTIDNLTPAQGDSLTASVADADGAGGSIAYQWYRDGVPIEGATTADHTTTQADVNKVITVTADYTDDLAGVESLTSAGSAPVTDVNDAPMLGNNRLSVSKGATVTLDSSMLSAADVDHPDASLVFNVSGVTAGYFALAGDPSTPVTSFDQSEISAGNVVFVHDGSEVQPGYSVSVSDGFASTAASPASIGFILPIPSDTVLTLPDDIPPPAATDEVKPEPPVDAPLSNGRVSQSAVTGEALKSISGLDQQDVANGIVVFIQEGNRVSTADSTAFRPEESARNDETASRPKALFSYQRLKMLLSAQNSGELQSALRNLHISTLSSSDYALVRNSLDAIREEISSEIQLGKTVLGSAIAASIGLSAGYVVWLLKGGSLLASVLSSLPAWQLTDPLAILAGKNGIGREEDGGDDESLETIIDDGKKIDEDKRNQTSELKNDKASR